jgi:hypothetical protein
MFLTAHGTVNSTGSLAGLSPAELRHLTVQHHNSTGSGFAERQTNLAILHNLISNFSAIGFVHCAQTVVVGTTGIVPMGNHGLGDGSARRGDEVGRGFRRAGVAGLVEAEGIPAVVIVGDDLVQFVAQAGETGAGGGESVLIVGLGGAGFGVALVAGGFDIADGLAGGGQVSFDHYTSG